MVEGDAGAGEGVLHEVGDAAGVPVGGDGDGAGVARGGEGGAHVLGDAVRVAAAGDVAVLDVPPDRGLRDRVLPHRRRRPPAPVSQAERPRVLGAWVFYWYRRRRRREGRGGGGICPFKKRLYEFGAKKLLILVSLFFNWKARTTI
jgi:hypothetical protein